MKILIEGTKKEWGIEQICTGAGNGEKEGACGATLMVEQGDIFQTSHSDYGGGHETFYTFECPTCKTWTDIPREKISAWVRELADNRHRSPRDRNRNND